MLSFTTPISLPILTHPSPKSRSPRMTLTPPAYSPRVLPLQNEGAYAVMAAAEALERRLGRKVIHLEIGQPCFPTPPAICEAATEALSTGKTKYSIPRGILSLRERIALWTNERRGTSYSAENVVVGPGAKPGLFFTTLALVRDESDEVVIPDPGFPTYEAMVQVAVGKVVKVGLDKGLNGFNMEKFEKCVNERTRIVILNSPGNPTGGVMNKEDLERVAELAKRYDFWVLSDEIYSELCYEPFESIVNIEGMRERTVLVDGFSKSFCMTGWRLGWAIMPETLANRVELLLVHSVGCTATFTQVAGLKALDIGVEKGMKEEYRKRRDLVVNGLNEIQGVKCEMPKGAFYAFADVSAFGKSSKEIADVLLKKGEVAVLPGSDFGQGGEGYIRISYVGEPDELKEGLKRIKETLDNL